jgi:hypothetical protein
MLAASFIVAAAARAGRRRTLGEGEGKFSFRRWRAAVALPAFGN